MISNRSYRNKVYLKVSIVVLLTAKCERAGSPLPSTYSLPGAVWERITYAQSYFASWLTNTSECHF